MKETKGTIDIYANIDMEQSGQKIKQMIQKSGYSVKEIQNYLHLSCPQPVYRWFHGQVLPTVDHLFMLSRLLGVHMEEFLVVKGDKKRRRFAFSVNYSLNRIALYCKYIRELNDSMRRCLKSDGRSGEN